MIQYPRIHHENSSSRSLSQTMDEEVNPEREMVVLDNLDSSQESKKLSTRRILKGRRKKESNHDRSSQDSENKSSSTYQRIINSIGMRDILLWFFALNDFWISVSMLCILMFQVYLPESDNSSAIAHYSLLVVHSVIILLLVYLSIVVLLKATRHYEGLILALSFTSVVIIIIALAMRQDDDLKSLACLHTNKKKIH